MNQTEAREPVNSPDAEETTSPYETPRLASWADTEMNRRPDTMRDLFWDFYHEWGGDR